MPPKEIGTMTHQPNPTDEWYKKNSQLCWPLKVKFLELLTSSFGETSISRFVR